jgi:hypothetical protein
MTTWNRYDAFFLNTENWAHAKHQQFFSASTFIAECSLLKNLGL